MTMMYYGGAMMWGGMFAGLVLVGLLVALFAALLFAGLAWLQRQGRESVEVKAQAVPVEGPRSLTHS
jgi:hypothetical protein